MGYSLEAAIVHCLEVAEEQEDFDEFQCEYRKLGYEDGVWKRTCRLPSNIPEGCSWGECSESNCPLFAVCLECASEHRQLAEWLKKLKAYEKAYTEIDSKIENDYIGNNEYTMAVSNGYLNAINIIDRCIEEVNADENGI